MGQVCTRLQYSGTFTHKMTLVPFFFTIQIIIINVKVVMSLKMPSITTDEFYTYLFGSIALSSGKLSEKCKNHGILMFFYINFMP